MFARRRRVRYDESMEYAKRAARGAVENNLVDVVPVTRHAVLTGVFGFWWWIVGIPVEEIERQRRQQADE